MDGNRKLTVFLFNLSSHFKSYIVKYLFIGETTVLARSWHVRFLSVAQKRHVLKVLKCYDQQCHHHHHNLKKLKKLSYNLQQTNHVIPAAVLLLPLFGASKQYKKRKKKNRQIPI